MQPPWIDPAVEMYSELCRASIALRWLQNLVGWDGLSVPRSIVREAAGGQAAKGVIAVSPKVRAEIRKFLAIRKRKITVIPGGYSGDNNSASRESLRRSLASAAK